MSKCIRIDHPNIYPGWGCCQCKTYNSDFNESCRHCGHDRCEEAAPQETEADEFIFTSNKSDKTLN